eukprot:CAMPEP_0119299790 /NCGR_PEP_ID=MMETSP1333-20130426/1826_1 /TAXON_ID=418940 /ORGANISM="Scyphosphaera apsteinii, Strain RCC1455" /LENGTH=399 /DNA_ID=CAMNT_0007301341 /DNA_START=129 /DNA_END=1328 /DNA_ORIENTATION=-
MCAYPLAVGALTGPVQLQLRARPIAGHRVPSILATADVNNPQVAVEVEEDGRGPSSPAASLSAFAALNCAALIWGSQHAITKDLVEAIPPSMLLAARFSLAATLTVPWWPAIPWTAQDDSVPDANPNPSNAADVDDVGLRQQPSNASATWKAAAELSIWSFLGFTFQTVGLQSTTASRSAFLLYLNVKLVPILAFVLYGRTSSARTWTSVALAFGGTALMANDGGPPNIGDVWSLCSALASACFILRLESAARTCSPNELSSATLACSAIGFIGWAALHAICNGPEWVAGAGRELGEHLSSLIYLAVVVTSIANWLQAFGQKHVSAANAAVIFALDPVYGAAFSWLLRGEQLGTQGLTGAAVILAGVLLSRLELPTSQKSPTACPKGCGDVSVVDDVNS